MLHYSTKRKSLILAMVIVAAFILFYFLPQVFSGALILPQTFSIGTLTLHYYGLTMALAAASGYYLALKRAPRYGIDLKQAENLLFWLIVWGFVGARFYHVLSSFSYYAGHPADILKVWNGGLSIYGALFGGLAVVLVFAKNHKLKALSLLDWLAPSLLLGQIIGRFGNLFNYEAFGYPTTLPWKMFVPFNLRPQQYSEFNFFHPFFLYEVLGNAIILFILLYFFGSRTRSPESDEKIGTPDFAKASDNSLLGLKGRAQPDLRPSIMLSGKLFFSYLLLYNLLRFGLEFLRIDSTFINGFRLNALMSLVLVVVSLAGLIYISKND